MGYSNGRHTPKYPMKDIVAARRHLDDAGKNEMKIYHNTVLYRTHDDSISIKFFYTNIVQFHRDGRIMLRNHGYRTPTTKIRIEAYTPFRLSSHSGEWFVHTAYGVFLFKDGISFMADGRPVDNAVKLRDAA